MDAYEKQYSDLKEAQRLAVEWGDGPLLVLAGPGSGKTMVLTSRIAKLLRESDEESFRVLALTFTNKAADEMQSRAQVLCDRVDDRATIGTFHSFCMQILQQHGSHIEVSPDFAIYSQDADRREILRDGLRKQAVQGAEDSSLDRYLKLIDKLKGMLVDVDEAQSKFRDPVEGANVARAYDAYEKELKHANALDFNSLILRSFQLVSKFDGIAQRYRRTYRYWMLDEFQDTNKAQYKFLQALAGKSFKNIFVVADDDQIIYQWNGASFAQMQRFRKEFEPELIQLPTNFRCPAPIVNAANNLVRHNTSRTIDKLPLEVGKIKNAIPPDQSILIGSYNSDVDEREAISDSIFGRDKKTWAKTVVLARNKALLESIKKVMANKGINAAISQRRDDFSSVEYRWLHALLKQVARPQDLRNFAVLVSAFDRWKGTSISADLVAAQADGSGRTLIAEWLFALNGSENGDVQSIADAISKLMVNPADYRNFVKAITKSFDESIAATSIDLEEDRRAWTWLDTFIAQSYGARLPLDQFLQHMALQSKEPPVLPDTVNLMTIHAAKGKEFEFVFLMGLAEDILPSFQSLKAGELSAEMEEERRNCFVAITRTREQLVMTWARKYGTWNRKPSRFLVEMGFDPSQF